MAKEKMYRGESFKSPMARLSFAQSLFKARAIDGATQEKFGCTLIFDKADLPVLEKQLRDAIVGQWKDKGLARAQAGKIKSPILMGDGPAAKDDDGNLKPGMGSDKIFIRVNTGVQDGVPQPPFVTWKDPNVQETQENVYSGCYGKAVLNAFAWSHDTGGDGVSFGLVGFQKLKEGERLGGERVSSAKYHETVEDLGDAPSETQGGAGAGGLFGG